VNLSLLIPKILPFFKKRDGITDRQTERQTETDDPNAICPGLKFLVQ